MSSSVEEIGAANDSRKKRKRKAPCSDETVATQGNKRNARERKLLVGIEVEVRQFDDGLKGSWHSGVVIGCEKSIRLVQYYNLLCDDGSSNLIERVSVSPLVEGQVAIRRAHKNYRGQIRPLPLNSNTGESELSYGLCVDAFVNDAWWEGVVFDCEKGSMERLVFFPDQGDQHRINVNHLRITHDWDEVSGDWKPRGDWVVIRLLEKYKGLLPVSIRQIWYDARANDDFRHYNLEWMYRDSSLWKKLVLKAIRENIFAACGGQAVTPLDSKSSEVLPVPLSKRRKTSKLQNVFNGVLSRERTLLETSAMDQDKQPVHTILSFSCESTVVSSEPAVNIRLEEGDFRLSRERTLLETSDMDQDKRPVHPILSFSCESTVVSSEPAVNVRLEEGDFRTHDCSASLATRKKSLLSLNSNSFGVDASSLTLAKDINFQGHDFHPDDFCLAADMPVTTSDSQCDEEPSMYMLPYGLKNEMVVSDVQREHKFPEQLLSCKENSCGERARTMHPVGGEDHSESSQSVIQGSRASQRSFQRSFGYKSNLKPKYCPQAETNLFSGYENNNYAWSVRETKRRAHNHPIAGTGLGNDFNDANHKCYVSLSDKENSSCLRACSAQGKQKEENIVRDKRAKTDLVFADQSAKGNSNLALKDGVSYEPSEQEKLSEPVGKELPSQAEYSQAIINYDTNDGLRKNQCRKSITLKTKMLLSLMGWKIKSGKHEHPLYLSPDGDTYDSLPKVFIDLMKQKRDDCSPGNCDGSFEDINDDRCDNQGSESVTDIACGENDAFREKSWKQMEEELLPRAEYIPQAITEYCSLDASKINRAAVLKVKMHLLFLGWKIESKNEKNKNAVESKNGKRSRTRYVSPDGKHFNSFRKACIYIEREEKESQSSRNESNSAGNDSVDRTNATLVESFHPEQANSSAEVQVNTKSNSFVSCCENPEVNITKQVLPPDPLSKDDAVEPDYCPQIIKDYLKYRRGKRKNELTFKVKMLLLTKGWRFYYVRRQEQEKVMHVLHCKSPSGRKFCSLRKACEAWVKGCTASSEGKNSSTGLDSIDLVETATTSAYNMGCKQLSDGQSRLFSSLASGLFRSGEHQSRTVQFKGIHRWHKRRGPYLSSAASRLLHKDRNACLSSHSMVVTQTKKDGVAGAGLSNKKLICLRDFLASQKLKKRKRSCAFTTRGDKVSMCTLRSSNREPHVVSCSSQQTIRTILSWLLDNDIVLPRQKVSYMHQKDHHIMAEGQITREGIKCKCCKNLYSLLHFEAHAGSSSRQPAANIFLEDGRSLLQCQLEILNGSKYKEFMKDANQRMKGDFSSYKNDNICAICHYGGDIILCDYCPSSFHLSCIGLKDVPEGKWSCSSCRCGICGESEFNADAKQFTAQTVLYCDQCKREFHVGCLRERGLTRLESCPQGNWFCSKKCSKIFMHLQKLLGKSKLTAVKGLSCTILRPKKSIGPDCYTDVDTIEEHHSKLCVAASLLHECFMPIVEPRTKRDLVMDVLFNKRSELKRLNFHGFYTMLLERGDELISVATVRVLGEKVAEIPLVATCVQYRRQGMCRLLMTELEKMLSNIGVEWLLLPAAPQLLETWTNSFGFTKMTSSDRHMFLEHTFLEFQGTTMCQKLLMQSTMRRKPRGHKDRVKFGRSIEEMDSHRCNSVVEVE